MSIAQPKSPRWRARVRRLPAPSTVRPALLSVTLLVSLTALACFSSGGTEGVSGCRLRSLTQSRGFVLQCFDDFPGSGGVRRQRFAAVILVATPTGPISTRTSTGSVAKYVLSWQVSRPGEARESLRCSVQYDHERGEVLFAGQRFATRDGNVFLVEYGRAWDARMRQLSISLSALSDAEELIDYVKEALPMEDSIQELAIRPSEFRD